MRNHVVQLRELLRERFPGVRFTAEPADVNSAAGWPTGLPQIDEPLRGGLPRGGITELLCPAGSSGSALVLAAILQQAAAVNQIATLIDGQDSFDPASLPAAVLRHLLWVRCRDADQVIKAADLVLRDANLSLVVLDLALPPPAQLRRIPATTWYRFHRLVEPAATTLLVITPQKLVSGAAARLRLQNRFGLESLDQPADVLVAQLRFEIEDLHRARLLGQIAAEAG